VHPVRIISLLKNLEEPFICREIDSEERPNGVSNDGSTIHPGYDFALIE
jgi:hypothetical protein